MVAVNSIPQEALRYFKTLGDETRLRLLNILCFQEFNVQELMEILDMGQSRISRHLKLLQNSGIIESRRDGLWAFYRAVDQGPGLRFTDSIRYLFEEDQIFESDIARAAEVLRTGKIQSRRFFDSLAPDWEVMKRSIIGELDLVGEIVNRVPRTESAADLGCGSGTLLTGMAGRVKTVVGVDSSREMLAEARRRLEIKGRKFDLRIGELEHLPLRDQEVDSAVINLVLHHLRNPREGLLETRRILRKAGTLIVVDFCKHEEEIMRSRYGDRWLGFSTREIELWLEEAGFTIEEQQLFPVRMGLTVVLYRSIRQINSG
jgi:ubiquinone/menaquinone biosynthesis C-methylase UbiE